MSAEDDRPALVPGHGAPAESVPHGSGVSSLDYAMRSRACAIDWAAVAPWFVEGEERREKERREREREAAA